MADRLPRIRHAERPGGAPRSLLARAVVARNVGVPGQGNHDRQVTGEVEGALTNPQPRGYDHTLSFGTGGYSLASEITAERGQGAGRGWSDLVAIRMSEDEEETWNVSRRIDTRPTAYADLTVLADSTLDLLYGTGALWGHIQRRPRPPGPSGRPS